MRRTNPSPLTPHPSLISLFLLLHCIACSSVETERGGQGTLGVKWELVTNFVDTPNVFEARFTLRNNGTSTLTDTNWALFFNMAPRPILPGRTPQPANVHHVNGDWYKLVPNRGFSLTPGDTVNITYWGTEGVSKETDRPLGLYLVHYDNEGKEDRIVEVSDYSFVPFTRPEQINRSPEDQEPIPTPEWTYEANEDVSLLPSHAIKKIIPTPARIKVETDSFKLEAGMRIFHDRALANEASYLAEKLNEVTGRNFQTEIGTAPAGTRAISLRVGAVNVDGTQHEAYRLSISQDGIVITGGDAAGVFYGVQSLRSLLPLEVYTRRIHPIPLPYTEIEDAPRFGFRGVHMDVARNFQTKETILRLLDLLSFYKINRFLLYTTEDEGWRLEIDGLPELTTVGAQRQHTWGMEAPVLHPAYGSGPDPKAKDKYGSGYYTREDFIEILKYAHARHIKVIPELNFPAHARAAIKAMEARYERLMEDGREEEANEYRLIDPEDTSRYLSAQGYKDNVVSVARESSFTFYEKVVDEIGKMYKEAGLVLDEFHLGGDEVPEGAWTGSPMARELLSRHPEIKDPKNLQAYFLRELLKRLKGRNLRFDAWEEAVLLKNERGTYDANPEFVRQSVVPFIWNNLFENQDLGYRLANAGYPVVLCNVSNFYFDLAYSKDPKEPGLYWGGFVDTRNAWLFAPFDMYKTTVKTSMGRMIDPEKEYAGKVRLNAESRKNILGLEAQLWSETIKGRDMVEYYMLPKLVGFSESAWAQQRAWEVIENAEARQQAITEDWNIFANTLGQKELPRLSYLHNGYNYRIPPPGAVISGGVLKANVSFPGLTLRYTTDGAEPDESSPEYTEPVAVPGPVIMKAFDAAGKASRPVTVTTSLDPRDMRNKADY